MYIRNLLTALLVCSWLMLGCSSQPQLHPFSSDTVIMAFGDSLTAGSGATADASYPAQLGNLIGRRVINAGVPGEVTAGGLARLPSLLEERKPTVVLLCLGANDFLRRLDPVKTEENLRSMIRMMRERGIEVVLIGVPQLRLGLEVPDWYGRLAKESGIPYEGKALARILADHKLKSDFVHPNAAGYRQLAEALAVLLKKTGALPAVGSK